jgi:hypothetical protein
MIRERGGMEPASALSMVVLPACVAPATSTLSPTLERSRRRPDALSICSTRSRTWARVRMVEVSSAAPRRATKTCAGSLIQISSTSGSSR